MSTISIEAKPAVFTFLPLGENELPHLDVGGHLLLVYKNDAGEEFVLRGGPEFFFEPQNSSNPFEPYGRLFSEINDPEKRRLLNDLGDLKLADSDDQRLGATATARGNKILDLGGRSADDVWAVLRQHAGNIHNRGFIYNPVAGQQAGLVPVTPPLSNLLTLKHQGNSNTFVANLLALVGININDVLPNPEFSIVPITFGIPPLSGFTAPPFVGKDVDLIFSYLIDGTEGNDVLNGGSGIQTFFGAGGDDRLTGGRDDDILNGGGGVDTAYYKSPLRENLRLQYNIERAENGADFIVASAPTRGDRPPFDGTDTLTEVELLQFPDATVDLTEYARYSEQETIVNQSGKTVGFVNLEVPVSMADKDADYTITLSSSSLGQGKEYNFAFIIDVSKSMAINNRLADAKEAYLRLIQSLIDQGIDDTSRFAVIWFSRNAISSGPVSAEEAKSIIEDLTVIETTNFAPPIEKAIEFFQQFPGGGTNLAYFLSDGGGPGASNALQAHAEVRAYGIGEADLRSLNMIDSGTAQILDNPKDLIEEFSKSGFDTSKISGVELLLDDVVVKTLTPDQFSDSSLGLTFEGSIDGLNVDIDAQNKISARVVLKDGSTPTTVDTLVKSGAVSLTATPEQGTAGDDTLILNAVTKNIDAGAGNDRVIGNIFSNIIDGGAGDDIIKGEIGDDQIRPGSGNNRIDGGDGIDTVIYDLTRADVDIEQAGGVTTVRNTTLPIDHLDTLSAIEFIEFTDVTLNLADKTTVPSSPKDEPDIPKTALLVVGDTNLDALESTDDNLKERLETLGFTVTVIGQGDRSLVNSTNNKDLVVISESVNSGTIHNQLNSITAPILSLEAYLFDNLKLTGNNSQVDFGWTSGKQVVDNGSSLEIYTNQGNIGWGVVGPEATVFATLAGNPQKAVVFGYEAGHTLFDGSSATGRRAGFFARTDKVDELTNAGWKLFDEVVTWSTRSDTTPLPLQPGIVSFENATYSINEDGTTTAQIQLTRLGGSDGDVTVSVTAQDNSTTSGDYQLLSNTVTFADGETQKIVQLQITDDRLDESDEQLTLTLSNPTNGATLGNQTTATITIVDNDDAPLTPGRFAIASANYSILENASAPQEIVINRLDGSDGEVSVTLVSQDETATASDYIPINQVVTFADGQTQQTIQVEAIDDNQAEANEQFRVKLQNPTNGSAIRGNGATHITIIDDESLSEPKPISFSIGGTPRAGAGKVSNVSGAQTINFDNHSAPTSGPVTYSTSSRPIGIVQGTVLGQYIAPTGNTTPYLNVTPVASIPGETPTTIEFAQPIDYFGLHWGTVDSYNYIDFYNGTELLQTVLGTEIATAGKLSLATDDAYVDFFAEAGQSFDKVVLRSGGNAFESDNHAYRFASVSPPSITGAIEFSTGGYTAKENVGHIEVLITRTKNIEEEVSVTLTTQNGTAIAPEDYTSLNSVITFAAGETQKTVRLDITDDLIEEADEQLTVILSNPTNGTKMSTQASIDVTIIDDDAPPASISANDALLVVGDTNLESPESTDDDLKERLETLGFTVTVIGQGDRSLVNRTNNKDLVVISESVNSGTIHNRLNSITAPILSLEAYLFDNLKLTGNNSHVDFGWTSGKQVVDNGSSLEIYTNQGDIGWGVVDPEATVFATLVGNPQKAVVFGYDAGDTLFDGSLAVGRRAGFFARTNKVDELTKAGWKLFDEVVTWATSEAKMVPSS